MAERTRTPSLTAVRTLGAIALLVIGGVHYQQYQYDFYSAVPTIGPLFLLNFISAAALGLFLIVPVRPKLGGRGRRLDLFAALSGIGVAAGGLAGLLISEQTPLFGFMEHGYRFAIVLAIAADAAAIALLTLYVVIARGRRPAPAEERGHAFNPRPGMPAAER
jgi:hypothetical protein